MLAYHFTGNTLRDGRPIPPIGEWLVHEGPVEMCASGLHYSEHPMDALQYAPGSLLHLVEVEDIVATQSDKGLCRRRKIIKAIDAERLLFDFARWCALQVIHLWDAPAVVRQFLETGEESLRDAARAAARDAVWDAAWDAVWVAQKAEFKRLVDAAFAEAS